LVFFFLFFIFVGIQKWVTTLSLKGCGAAIMKR
jgi:hypothetical protein